MKSSTFPTQLRAALVLSAITLFVTTSLAATEKVLHNFGSGMDGASPSSSLIWDAAGNLYGTTWIGGVYGYGTAFEMTPRADGGWTEKVLHNFGSGMDGRSPSGALVFDAAGNLYGTTNGGGTHGYGTAFEMTPRADGGWTEKVLHNFGINGTDGLYPQGLIFDAAGNLYGTTAWGGAYDDNGECGPQACGTAFELTPRQDGGWTEKVLHNFGASLWDGENPQGLVFDAAGNLYGTTWFGGTHGFGTVFELTPKPGGGWTEKAIHNFGITQTDGQGPGAGLVFDAAGNLYGTTAYGGTHGVYGRSGGTAFEVMPNEGGGWTEKVIHSFGGGTDGARPEDVLILDADGNLYGTTERADPMGCSLSSCGAVFKLTPAEGGSWTETVLHTFLVNGVDGMEPSAGLIFDGAGNLYGTTAQGGTHNNCLYLEGCGTAFEITPN